MQTNLQKDDINVRHPLHPIPMANSFIAALAVGKWMNEAAIWRNP